MSKVYNWGIIAPGKIAHKFAQGLAVIKNARLHAVASRSEERAKAFAEAYGAGHYYGSYEAITDCPDLDVVYIASPHAFHCEHTLLCLQKKIPVLCEKPFAINADEVRQMMQIAQENQTFLMEALWTRFLPTTLKALELIQDGSLGEVHGIKADFGFRAPFNPEGRLYNPALGGGSLLDIGIYPAFLSQLILGKPTAIKATAKLSATQVDEECAAIFEYEGGKIAQIHSTLRCRTKTEAFIYGEKGAIHIHTRWHEPTTMSLLLEGERPQDFRFDFSGNGYNYQAVEVMKCLDQGKLESPLWPLQSSLDLISLLDDIRSQIGVGYPNDQ